MKKQEQENINNVIIGMYEEMMKENSETATQWLQLHYCNAFYWHTENFIILQSYDTIVAFIDKRTDILYDVLRYVYGYTATSSQHISKFNRDCGYTGHGCQERLTYR